MTGALQRLVNRFLRRVHLLVIALLLLAPPAASAQVVNADGDPLTPPGHPGAIRDTATGLLWLDATETVGRSVADVRAQLGAGGEFACFSLATRAQLHQLLAHAGLRDTTPWESDPALVSRAQSFLSLYGQTTGNGTQVWHRQSEADRTNVSVLWNGPDAVWIGDLGSIYQPSPTVGVALFRGAACGPPAGVTLTVNSTVDDLTPADGRCTLREALINANEGGDATGGDCAAGGGHDRIELPAGHYVLSLALDGEDLSLAGDLDVLDDVTLHGAGAAVTTIDAGGMEGLVDVIGVDAELEGVTLTGSGNRFGPYGPTGVAAVMNRGARLTVSDAIVRSNMGGCWSFVGCGAGIASFNGTTTIRRSLLTDNEPGAVLSSGGTTRIENSTISRNREGYYDVCGYPCWMASPSAIVARGPVTVVQSTIADNHGWVLGGALELRGVLLSNPTGLNCDIFSSGSVVSLGANLDSDGSCNLGEPTDRSGIAALLSPLADNGGPTPTYAPLPGSPAIDAIPAADCSVADDQRGVARPSEGDGLTSADCDIGALEVNECGDGLDNDADGLTDAADFGCASAADVSEQNPPYAACSDATDNDGDGLVDLADPECARAADTSEHVLPACFDGDDDDGDGLADLTDPGCADFADPSEQDAALVCDDGVDNDADGVVDTADPACAAPDDPSEHAACQDGLDNDFDHLADAQDPGCTEANDLSENIASLVCDDGLDNDGDGSRDAFDPSCASPTDTSEVDCEDGFDNDADGLVDALDPGCDSPTDTREKGPAFMCDDGLDNDGDGQGDLGDPSCTGPTDPSELDCDDGLDNDGDGHADAQDPGCTSTSDPRETESAVQCDDGLDNDWDGRPDRRDPSCASLTDPTETDCDDGLDNDGDGVSDGQDPGCTSAADQLEWEQGMACDDGNDNDGDGRVDLKDPSCTSPASLTERSGLLACDDGADNDGDGYWDLTDPACRAGHYSSERSKCQDGRDNDGDGFVDFDGGQSRGVVGKRRDPSCAGKPWKDTEGKRQSSS